LVDVHNFGRYKRNFIDAVEVYPPAWQAIIDEGYFLDYNGILYSRDIGDDETLGQQTIYLHYLIRTGEGFVVHQGMGSECQDIADSVAGTRTKMKTIDSYWLNVLEAQICF
jgi:hypothetical protein